MEEPILYVLGITELNLCRFCRMCLIFGFNFQRALANFRFMPVLPENILHKSSDVPCHGSLLELLRFSNADGTRKPRLSSIHVSQALTVAQHNLPMSGKP